uniref:Calponin 1 n=1 Tax=Coturnix japonica TaxID=93934 RepID=A0A8C2SS50_COTJA
MSKRELQRGPAYGLSAEVKNKLAQKYDPQTERQLRVWIEGATGRRIGDNFMDGLKDGVILWNFLRAIKHYGVKPHDIFEANDLFENTNHTQVQSTLIALASQAKTKGNNVGLGVKYAEKQQRRFQPEKLREGRNIIGLQVMLRGLQETWRGWGGGTQPRSPLCQPVRHDSLWHQEAGMTAPGTKRQIFEPSLGMERCDTNIIGLQMGSNKGASQQGMTVYGLPRQVYDPKYCDPQVPASGTPSSRIPAPGPQSQGPSSGT